MRPAFARGGAALALGLGLSLMVTRPATGSTPGGCHPGRHLVCIDQADSGHRVGVKVGQTVTVDLGGSGLRWSGLRQVGPHLLAPVGRATYGTSGSRASYHAVRRGTTSLQASGAPTCSAGQACPQFIELWRVRITVN